MLTPSQLRIMARLLYIALGYESREVKIRAMLNTSDTLVAMMAAQLKFAGYLKTDGIEKEPK